MVGRQPKIFFTWRATPRTPRVEKEKNPERCRHEHERRRRRMRERERAALLYFSLFTFHFSPHAGESGFWEIAIRAAIYISFYILPFTLPYNAIHLLMLWKMMIHMRSLRHIVQRKLYTTIGQSTSQTLGCSDEDLTGFAVGTCTGEMLVLMLVLVPS